MQELWIAKHSPSYHSLYLGICLDRLYVPERYLKYSLNIEEMFA